MHTGAKYVIKRIDAGNLADLEKLYSRVYSRRVPHNYYQQKLVTGFIAYADDQPVASLCLVPGFPNSIMQLTDGMTDPAHRGKGLFSKLLVSIIKESGEKLIVGFPNQNAYPVLIKNGWEDAGQLDRFEIPVKRNLYRRIVQRKRFDSNLGIGRNEEFLKYKSFTGTGTIFFGNAKAWIKFGTDLWIGDIDVTENDFDRMMNKISRAAVQSGAGKIHFQCGKGNVLHSLFSKRYEAIPSFHVVVKRIGTEINTDLTGFTLADIDIF